LKFSSCWLGIVLGFCVIWPSVTPAQSPTPAATGPAKDNPGGFTPGITLGAKFEGSYSGDGGVYNFGSALGYNFSRHFGVDAGVPFYFVSTPTSVKNNNPGAVSGIGVGSFFTDLRWNYPNKSLNYSSAVHVTAPTGDKKKGLASATRLGTRRTISIMPSEISHRFSTPESATPSWIQSFSSALCYVCYNAQFNGGVEYDPGKFSFSVAAYDVAPWGNQTVISRVFRCGSAKCNSAGPTKNRKSFTTSNVSTGAADLVRDNGYNAGIDYKPVGYLDLESILAAVFRCNSTATRSESAWTELAHSAARSLIIVVLRFVGEPLKV